MKNLYLTAIIFLAGYVCSFAQGTIRGKITDYNGEALIGVAVTLKVNPANGTITDLDGNYSFKLTDSTTQAIVVHFVGFRDVEQNVHLQHGEVVVKNFTLKSTSQEIKEVEVTAKAVKSKEYFVESIKKNSATSIDYISSETLKKTGDVNVTAAVARVAGVSTNGSFITVRGIGDRYVKTGING